MVETDNLGARSHALPSVLDLAGAEPLMLTLRDLLVQEKPLCLDGSQVQRVSTACLQVLVAACQSARAHQVPYVLDAPSTALSAAMQDLGLSPVMLGAAADATPDMALGALPA